MRSGRSPSGFVVNENLPPIPHMCDPRHRLLPPAVLVHERSPEAKRRPRSRSPTRRQLSPTEFLRQHRRLPASVVRCDSRLWAASARLRHRRRAVSSARSIEAGPDRSSVSPSGSRSVRQTFRPDSSSVVDPSVPLFDPLPQAQPTVPKRTCKTFLLRRGCARPWFCRSNLNLYPR